MGDAVQRPERSQEHGERTTAAPQAKTAAPQADRTTSRARASARRPVGGLRPSQVPVVQPKLRLGAENDHHEREADRLAEGLAASARAADRGAMPANASQRVIPAGSSVATGGGTLGGGEDDSRDNAGR